MKYIAALFMLIAISKEGFANNQYAYYPPVIIQPQIIVTQTMVYQAPHLLVTIPVPMVVYPQPVYQERIYWGYPYYIATPMPTIERKHRCWNY